METNKTDKMLQAFFKENKHEIADNGFSKRVMTKLPEQKDSGWIVWLFGALGMTISLYLGLTEGVFNQLIIIIEKIPFYYMLAAIAAFPLIATAGFYLFQDKRYSIV